MVALRSVLVSVVVTHLAFLQETKGMLPPPTSKPVSTPEPSNDKYFCPQGPAGIPGRDGASIMFSFEFRRLSSFPTRILCLINCYCLSSNDNGWKYAWAVGLPVCASHVINTVVLRVLVWIMVSFIPGDAAYLNNMV
jgi:hypothetical protein